MSFLFKKKKKGGNKAMEESPEKANASSLDITTTTAAASTNASRTPPTSHAQHNQGPSDTNVKVHVTTPPKDTSIPLHLNTSSEAEKRGLETHIAAAGNYPAQPQPSYSPPPPPNISTSTPFTTTPATPFLSGVSRVDTTASTAAYADRIVGRPPTAEPSHPQLIENTPLVTSNYHQGYSGRSPDARAPQALIMNNNDSSSNRATFPPAYGSFYAASAPSPVKNSPAFTNVSSTVAMTGGGGGNAYPSPTPGLGYSPNMTTNGTNSYQNSPQAIPSTPSSSPFQNNGAYHTVPPPMQTPNASTSSPMQAFPGAGGIGMNKPWSPNDAYGPTTSTGQQQGHIILGSEHLTYPIIMAIDWGTTFSSMAYAYQQDGEIYEVSTWPKQMHNYPKVPTCNLYGPGSKEILEWGYPAKLAMTRPPYKNHILLSKYKLHLDDASGPHPPLPNGLTVVDAIADYLRMFHAHVLQTVLRGFGAAFDQHHIQYCLSVPAMWTDQAKSLMRQAALQAGMISPLDPPHRLLLISEPEAAALYCEKKCDQFSIGHGERFMICDAGGGTVDLIVFEVAVGPEGRTLREVTRGSGHSCGSIFLDERMEALLRRKFARWQHDRPLTSANWVQLMETFINNVKPLFDGIDDQYLAMPAVPGRADLTDYEIGLEDGILTVTAEEMRREVFDPVVDDVLRLIQHQLQQTHFNCQAIFLVGGFGCSGYLLTRAQSEFSSIVRLITVPPRAELAVVRGAALAGITPRIVAARVSRRWYGVDSLMAFEVGYDMPHKQVQDHEGQLRARDRFSVYVAPGQQIGVDECITKRYVTYQYPKPINSPLYACPTMTMPRYVDSPMVEKIGDFTIPLPFIPGAMPGHKVMFELRMYFGATEIRAEAEVNGLVVSTRCQFSG